MAEPPLNLPPQPPQVMDEESMIRYISQLTEWLVYATKYINDNT